MPTGIETIRQPERDLRQAYAEDVVAAFAQRPYLLPTKYLYDARGSELFAEFSASSPSYYPHAEGALIDRHHRRLAAIFERRRFIEFGAGACPRLSQLLSLGLVSPQSTYEGVDISEHPMVDVLSRITSQFPMLVAKAHVADFEAWETSAHAESDGATLVLWFGNTVANMTEERLIAFLRQLARSVRAPLDILLGIDLADRCPDVESRFSDPRGLFARFRWNALERLNETFHGDADARNYDLRLEYNHDLRQAESAFVARRRHCLSLRDLGLAAKFDPGDRLVVGITRDIGSSSLESAASGGGWKLADLFKMPESTYALAQLRAPGLPATGDQNVA